jgi:hypothetical protein
MVKLLKNQTIKQQIGVYLLSKDPKSNADINDIFMDRTGSSLRLTVYGKNLMNTQFDSYEFSIQQHTKISVGRLVSLSKEMTAPYYLKITKASSKIILYSKDDAIILKLSGGFENWITQFS